LKNNRKLLKWLIAFVGILAFILTGQPAVSAHAASINGNTYVTSGKVLNGPDFKPADTINVAYHLEFGEEPLHNGDVITVSLPSNLSSAKTDTFDVTGPDGTVIGQGKVTKGGNSIEVTLNDKVEGLSNKELDLSIATKYNGDDYGEQTVTFPNQDHDVINIVPDDANLSKKGEIQDNNTVKWTVLVNRRELELKNLKISDTIGENQTMIKDVTVSNAKWTSNTKFKREKPALTAGTDYTVSYKDDGFDLAFNNTVSNLVTIDYYTDIVDPSVIHDGYVFRNQAMMTWGGGTSGGSHSEIANGKVSTTGKNSGTGTGDVNDKDTDGDGEIDVDGDIDTDGDPDTGTVDIDDGTDTDTTEPNDKTHSHQKPARKPAQQPAKPTAKEVIAAKKAADAKVLGVSNRNHKRAARNHKLPRTNERRGQAAVLGVVLLTSLTLVGLGRHRF